jgi:hypothetical protein
MLLSVHIILLSVDFRKHGANFPIDMLNPIDYYVEMGYMGIINVTKNQHSGKMQRLELSC